MTDNEIREKFRKENIADKATFAAREKAGGGSSSSDVWRSEYAQRYDGRGLPHGVERGRKVL